MSGTPGGERSGEACYVVPRRILRGSAADMLREIDEAIEALLAVRLVVLSDALEPQSAANRYPTHGSVST